MALQDPSTLPHPAVPSTHPGGDTSQAVGAARGRWAPGQKWWSQSLYSLGRKRITREDDAFSPRTVPEALPLGHVSPGLPQNWTWDSGRECGLPWEAALPAQPLGLPAGAEVSCVSACVCASVCVCVRVLAAMGCICV